MRWRLQSQPPEQVSIGPEAIRGPPHSHSGFAEDDARHLACEPEQVRNMLDHFGPRLPGRRCPQSCLATPVVRSLTAKLLFNRP